MAEHNPNPPQSLSDEDVKTPNIFERAKEGIGSVIHSGKIHHFHKETHGNRDDIDENTPLDDVKAPNVFERAKEEIEALVETVHHKEESETDDDKRNRSAEEDSKHGKLGSLVGKAKEEMKSVVHTSKEHFFKGTRDKHDDSGDGEKSPNVFERAKDKIETLVEKVHDDKESQSHHDKRDRDSDDESKDHDKRENGINAPDLIEKTKEDIKAAIHSGKAHFHKETHEKHSDSDDEDVKAPNVFERAKEEIEALAETIRQNKVSHTPDDERDHSTKEELKNEKPGISDKASDLIDRAKEEIKSMFHHDKSPHHHHKETHGRSDDIDETTPLNEVKAPNVFERAKEEIDAIVGKVHPKKDSDDSVPSPNPSPKDEGTFRHCLGLSFEKICHPWGSKRD